MLRYQRPKQDRGLRRVTNIIRDFNLLRLCVISALILLVWGACLLWQQTNFDQYFKFHHVKIATRADHLDPKKLAMMVGDNIQGGFFALDTTKLHSALKAQPWIKSITFRRLWPDTLLISVTEQEPQAQWNRTELISKEGIVFAPDVNTFPSGLVKLSGPKGEATLVLQKLKQFQTLLQPIGANITMLELNARNSWQMQINGRFEVMLGQKDVDRIFKRFITLYPRIIAPFEEKALTVDMRYPNGAAIKWQENERKGNKS